MIPPNTKKGTFGQTQSIQYNLPKQTITATFNQPKPVQSQLSSGIAQDTASSYYQKALQARHTNQWQEVYRYAQACFSASDVDVMLSHNAKCLAASALMRMNQTEQALALWQDVEKSLSDDAGILANIGMALMKLERPTEAIDYLQRAVRLMPSHNMYINLGLAFYHQGNLAQAKENYRNALVYEPNSVPAKRNLAMAMYAEGNSEEILHALQLWQEVEKSLPNDVDILANIGKVLIKLERSVEAINYLQRAVELVPSHDAYLNLGVAFYHQGDMSQAKENYRKALIYNPKSALAKSNLEFALSVESSYEELQQILILWQDAEKSLPNDADILANVGKLLIKLERHVEAIDYLQRAVELAPSHDFYILLGAAFYNQGQKPQAKESFRQALVYDPKSVSAKHNLAMVIQSEGNFEEAQQMYEQVLELDPSYVDTFSNIILMQHVDLPRQQETLKRYREYFEDAAHPLTRPTLRIHTPLRVGFVSGDLRQHPVAYFLESILEQLRGDPKLSTQLELVAYHTNGIQDEYTHRIHSQFGLWHKVNGWSNDRVTEQIQRDRIDILIDLSGHTAANRLPVFTRRPAPLQVSWLGYFGSTGLTTIDYVLADPISVPANEEHWFVEKIWRLPHLRYCFSVPQNAPDVSPPPCVDRPYVVFGCYQVLSKINRGVLRCWSRVLASSPQARLRIQSLDLEKVGVKEPFILRLEASGIDIGQVDLIPLMKRDKYFGSYSEVDILLDTFPYPGGTTTAEALWMGVPTLTLATQGMLGRQGEALMVNAGLSDWVTYSEEEYIQKAIGWANADVTQRQRLASLRAGMREQVRQSPVFNAKQFAHDFVDALYGMWQEKVDTQPAD